MKTKSILSLALLIAFVAWTLHAFARPKDSLETQIRFSRIESDISEIRRDQINYKIEKDLLKETFSTNYQTINLVVTIVLGVFAIVGYLGIRDIGAIKKEYLAELEKINDLRKDLELKVSKIGEDQEKVKGDYLQIVKINEEQNRRIKVLELQEKIASLADTGNHQRALEYVAVALDLDPDNIILLDLKARSLWGLNDLSGALVVYSQLIKHDPTNRGVISNMLELFLLVNRPPEFDELYKTNRSWLDQRDNSVVSKYFNLLRLYQLDQQDQMLTELKQFVQQIPDEQGIMTKWQFNEVLSFMKGRPESITKVLLLTFITLISGQISKGQASEAIEKAVVTK